MPRYTVTCAYFPCTNTFEVAPWDPKIYCSPKCYHAAKSATVENFAERFWAKVDKTPGYGPWGDCWLWTGATHAHGYGNFRATPHKPGNVSAHIVSWFIHTGEWPPDDRETLHRCDMRPCVQFPHLFQGSHQDNMQDMLAKGRGGMQTKPELAIEGIRRWNQAHPTRPQTSGDKNGMRLHPDRVPRGERNGHSKLADAQWEELLLLWQTGQWTQTALAKRFGITSQRVGQKVRAHKLS